MKSTLTNCKTCNGEIAKSAKVCPGCGAKIKKPFYMKWWVWIIAIIIISSIASNSGDKGKNTTPTSTNSSTSNNSTQPTQQAKKEFKIGETVKAGDIEYTVASVQDKKSIGQNEFTMKNTENNFIVLKVSVKNMGDKSKTIDTNMFKLKDFKGTTYSADAGIAMYANEVGKSFFLQQVNPNITTTGFVVFETPTKNADTPYILEVSGGLISVQSADIKLIQ